MGKFAEDSSGLVVNVFIGDNYLSGFAALRAEVCFSFADQESALAPESESDEIVRVEVLGSDRFTARLTQRLRFLSLSGGETVSADFELAHSAGPEVISGFAEFADDFVTGWTAPGSSKIDWVLSNADG